MKFGGQTDDMEFQQQQHDDLNEFFKLDNSQFRSMSDTPEPKHTQVRIDHLGGDASLLHLASQIDRGIHRLIQQKETPYAKKWRKFIDIFWPVRTILLVFYVFITQFEKPAWCLHFNHLKDNGTDLERDLYKDWNTDQCNNIKGEYTNSNLPKFSPDVTLWLELAILAILLGFQRIKNLQRELDKNSLNAWRMIMLLTALSVTDIFVVLVTPDNYAYPWIAAYVRPFYFIFQIRVLREYWNRYLLVIKDSMPMVLFIIAYILYFSWIGQRLFSGSIEGTENFGSFGNSFFTMLVCMTTSNFPDVMLPAYNMNRFYALYFIIYLVFGLFLMMNLLLAIFYSNFKSRFAENLDKKEEMRSDYLFSQFTDFGGSKGYLNQQETYQMIMMIHGLVTNTDQTVYEEDMVDDVNTSHLTKKTPSADREQSRFRTGLSMKRSSKKLKKDISYSQYLFIWNKKINTELQTDGQFTFQEINILLNAYESWSYENMNNQVNQDNITSSITSSKSTENENKKEPWLIQIYIQKLGKIMTSPIYEFFVNVIGIFNILCILIIQLDNQGSTSFIRGWIVSQIVLNFLFFFELVTDFIIHGFINSYKQLFRMWPETVCQGLFFFVLYRLTLVKDDDKNIDVKLLELVIFVRILKLLTLLYEIKTLRIIIETMRNLLKPLMFLSGTLVSIFYIFALIGMQMFGGKIYKGSPKIEQDASIPNDYHLMNFNDLLSSFCTLFALMVVNNWMIIARMYVKTVDSAWVEFYFGIFYYFSVVIGINIVVAFAIDMYSSVERLDMERTKTLDILQEELEMAKIEKQELKKELRKQKLKEKESKISVSRLPRNDLYMQLPDGEEDVDVVKENGQTILSNKRFGN